MLGLAAAGDGRREASPVPPLRLPLSAAKLSPPSPEPQPSLSDRSSDVGPQTLEGQPQGAHRFLSPPRPGSRSPSAPTLPAAPASPLLTTPRPQDGSLVPPGSHP